MLIGMDRIVSITFIKHIVLHHSTIKKAKERIWHEAVIAKMQRYTFLR